MKKNILSFFTGPPKVPPYWFWFNTCLVLLGGRIQVAEKVVGVENGITQEFKSRSVKLIRARLRHHIHVGARFAPIAGSNREVWILNSWIASGFTTPIPLLAPESAMYFRPLKF